MVVQVGDGYPIRYRAVDSDRVLIDVTLTLELTAPDGAVTSPSPSHTSTGIYDYAIPVTAGGMWQYEWIVTSPYTDRDKGQFTASAFAPPDYVSLPLFKLNLKTTAVTHEELMAFAVSTASRKVEEFCYRRFWADPTTTTREYEPWGRTLSVNNGGYQSEKLLVDDIASTTGLIVQVGYGSTWTTIDSSTYDFAPDNALADYKPIEAIVRRGACWTTHPRQRIRVTAKHGWPSIPQAVAHASLIQATRLYLRKDSPEGVAGGAEWGVIRMARVDPDVQELLKDLVKIGAGSTG